MSDEVKVQPTPEPKTFVVNNGGSSIPAWASLAVSAVVTCVLAWSTYRQNVPPGPPAPPPAPVVVPVKIDPSDAISTKDGIRLDAEKTKLLCDLVNAGEGNFTLRYQPIGKAELTRTVVVSGGVVPPKPVVDPVKPVTPDVPPVDPNTKVTAVTYVYEKDATAVPNHVTSALNKINRESNYAITATLLEDGEGVPPEYKPAYEAAKKIGLPAAVVSAGGTVLKTVKAPKTEAEILEAAK